MMGAMPDTPRPPISAAAYEMMTEAVRPGNGWLQDLGGGFFSDPLSGVRYGFVRQPRLPTTVCPPHMRSLHEHSKNNDLSVPFQVVGLSALVIFW